MSKSYKLADIDNLYKAVTDSAQDVIYPNDRQIVEASISKEIVEREDQEGFILQINELAQWVTK